MDRQLALIAERVADGTITAAAGERLEEFAAALDDATTEHTYHDRDGTPTTMSPRTIEAYLRCIRLTAAAGIDPLDTSADAISDQLTAFHDDAGKSRSTVGTYAAAFQAFYRYFNDLGIDPDAIEFHTTRSPSKYDETDMFTEDEVAALRDACGETRNPVRNRAFLELLIFTGQRLTALLTLRVGDVDLDGERGYIHLNDDYDAAYGGMKNALARGRKRPIFGARKYVRDWLQYHPRGDADDDWLFVGDPNHWKTDPDDHWSRPSARARLGKLKEYAGVDKPVEPHNFRHYCATVLYRDYDLDRDTIRMLLGHVEGSTALETTYSHLFDEDYIRRAEAGMGYRDEEDRSPFTPDACPTCGELLEDNWRQCPSCQELFGPTEELREELAAARDATTIEAIQSLDADTIEGLATLVDAVDDVDALADTVLGELRD